ncbi:NTP/NDP exchange transporter [Celerinatantimonas sp. YJH-8]|uniref:NTP/NDP exchange transporter n=1 Tax=Celerinatantimonas sp. YJH-8 TaxID=3228714 RepID=UPI0038C31FD2
MKANASVSFIRRFIGFQPGEGVLVAWSALYIIALFLAYYVLRPIRDELGAAGGVYNLPWLFLGTLVAMLIMNPIFSFLVKKWSRPQFIAIVYRFFILNLVLFIVAIQWATPAQHVWIGRIFFIWVSVFNLFVISVFWSLVVDTFSSEQGKRIFGALSAGATLGGIIGAGLTSLLVAHIGQSGLMIISILLLEVAVQSARRLALCQSEGHPSVQQYNRPIGGKLLAGIVDTCRSPYLLAISGFILLQTMTATFLYFEQAHIAQNYFSDRAARTEFFARIDLWVNSLTLMIQLFVTGRVIRWLGIGAVLCTLPLVCLIGFSSLAFMPSITVFLVVQIARRVGNYALTRPSREVLFTVVSREDRYKSKNFIDTVVYRGGDQIASWSYAGLIALGLSMSGIAIVAIPISVIWLGLGSWLGLQQRKQARKLAEDLSEGEHLVNH